MIAPLTRSLEEILLGIKEENLSIVFYIGKNFDNYILEINLQIYNLWSNAEFSWSKLAFFLSDEALRYLS